MGGVRDGLLANAPTLAIKALGAEDWHLAQPTSLTGVGLILSLIVGVWMAHRPKMPFVLAPGFVSCLACFGMTAVQSSLWFLFLLGIGNLFEVVTRPAITAIIRANYPVSSRGWVTGRLRQWSAGTFLVTALATASLLDLVATRVVIQLIVGTAATVQTLGLIAFALIRERADSVHDDGEPENSVKSSMKEAASTLRQDTRFQRYLVGCFLFGVGALAYDPIVRSYFSHELRLNYTLCVLFVDVVPGAVQTFAVRRTGGLLDRTNPLLAWAVIRAAWAVDPLLLAIAPVWPRAALAIVAAGRISRGSVMGVSYILSWQLGTNYFAKRRHLTSVYMGMFLTVTGIQRICGPNLGALIGALLSRRAVLVIGGLVGLMASLHAMRQAEAEKVNGRYPTFADQELAELAAQV